MNKQDYTTTLLVAATPQQVFNAINNVRGWWSENIEGDTDKPNAVFNYHYQDVHACSIHITGFVPGKEVTWKMQDNYFKFTKDRNELKGSDIIFDISEKDGKTQLVFTHNRLMPACECYQICSDAWTHYIRESLKNLILTGKGNATPKEESAASSEQSIVTQDAAAIHHRLHIEKPVENVYEALTTQRGLAGWWTPDTVARPEAGSVSVFSFEGHSIEIKVEELKPYSLVKWSTIKASEEWTGTTMTFELQPHAKGMILAFHHEGWKAYSEHLASCSYDWALFLRSLKFLCEKGKGFPYPDFDK